MIGRPRVHPEGTTPADRTRASREASKAAGGRLLQVRLDADAIVALDRIKAAHGLATDSAAVIKSIEVASRKAKRP